MDLETGERSRDSETGELLPYPERCDSETGETEAAGSASATDAPARCRRTFRIPARLGAKVGEPSRRRYEDTREMSPALLFLFPTLFFYPAATTIVIAVLELAIHIWAHKKNKQMTDRDVYYRSPMHVIVSEFCARCRDAKSMDKIGRMQDERALRFRCSYEYVRRIVT